MVSHSGSTWELVRKFTEFPSENGNGMISYRPAVVLELESQTKPAEGKKHNLTKF